MRRDSRFWLVSAASAFNAWDSASTPRRRASTSAALCAVIDGRYKRPSSKRAPIKCCRPRGSICAFTFHFPGGYGQGVRLLGNIPDKSPHKEMRHALLRVHNLGVDRRRAPPPHLPLAPTFVNGVTVSRRPEGGHVWAQTFLTCWPPQLIDCPINILRTTVVYLQPRFFFTGLILICQVHEIGHRVVCAPFLKLCLMSTHITRYEPETNKVQGTRCTVGRLASNDNGKTFDTDSAFCTRENRHTCL